MPRTRRSTFLGGEPGPFKNFLLGAAGVDLFFVISGFVMVYSSESLFGRTDAPQSFSCAGSRASCRSTGR